MKSLFYGLFEILKIGRLTKQILIVGLYSLEFLVSCTSIATHTISFSFEGLNLKRFYWHIILFELTLEIEMLR